MISDPTSMLDETEIAEVKSTKILGIYLEDGLTGVCNVQKVSWTLSQGVYNLRQIS